MKAPDIFFLYIAGVVLVQQKHLSNTIHLHSLLEYQRTYFYANHLFVVFYIHSLTVNSNMASQKLRSLLADAYEGDIDGIHIRWGDTAKEYLAENAARTQQTEKALKAITESVLVGTAERLGHNNVIIT